MRPRSHILHDYGGFVAAKCSFTINPSSRRFAGGLKRRFGVLAMPLATTSHLWAGRKQVVLQVVVLGLAIAGTGLVGVGILANAPAEAAPTPVTVQVGQKANGTSGSQYNPASVSVELGTTVTFARFAGSHDVTSAVVAAGASAFASLSPMGTGSTFPVTPSATGTYTYYCTIHSDATEATLANVDANIAAGKMVGKIVVTGAAPTPTPTSAPPTTTATATVTATGTTAATATATATAAATATATASATSTPASTPTATPPPPPPAPGDVQIVDFAFSPSDLTVAPGTSVRWVNAGIKPHTVTAKDGSFDSGLMVKGDAYSRVFSTAGSYEYYCDVHPQMVGTVTVAATTGAGTPPAGPSSPPAPLPGDIEIMAFFFSPEAVTVTAGTTVRWVNLSAKVHTVTARDGSFASPPITKYRTFSYTFTKPGKYEYYSTGEVEFVGLQMVGTVTVTAPPTPTPVPAASKTPATSPGTPGEVQVVDFAYSPAALTVAPGTSVRWLNTGAKPHTVTADDGSFDSGFMSKGDAFKHTFSGPGTYKYYCAVHPDMVASVTVSDGGSAPSTAPPKPSAPAPAGPSSPPRPARVAPGDVQVVDFDYAPRTITVNAGASLRFANAGNAPHTVTARDGTFDSGLMVKGDAFTRTFPTPGTFDYFCSIHPNMTGSVRVLDGRGSIPLPAPATPAANADPSATQPPSPSEIAIADFSFEPRTLTVRRGTEVTWRNTGVAPHTVTARDGSFDSGLVKAGELFKRRFDVAGTFAYFCTLHPNMEGTLVVGDSGEVAAVAGSGAAGQRVNGSRSASGPEASGEGFKNLWLLVWGLVALAGLVALPTVLIAARPSATQGGQQ